MVNSTWTKNHVDSILAYSDPLIDFVHLFPPQIFLRALFWYLANKKPTLGTEEILLRPTIVYPPCPTKEMSVLSLEKKREAILLSIAQFRPEKDHNLQLRAFAQLLETHPEYRAGSGTTPATLVLIGGSRGTEDASRVEELKKEAKALRIDTQTIFLVNAEYSAMLEWLSKASVGINTMVDEHFGISVVELMAAGVIPVVHASGGPLQDIVTPFNGKPTGYHATSPGTFAEAFHKVLSLSSSDDLAIRERARRSSERFSDEVFVASWGKAISRSENSSAWSTWLTATG